MTASWLVQADWPDTYVLRDPFDGVELAKGDYKPTVLGLAGQPSPLALDPAQLNERLKTNGVTVLDVASSSSYRKGHIPGAWFVNRARLEETKKSIPSSASFVVTGDNLALAALAARDLTSLTGKPVSVLTGGNAAWRRGGFPLKSGMEKAATPVDDVFVQPFLAGPLEDNPAEFRKAADAYLSWELQLPEQLDRAKETDFKMAGK